MATERRRHPRVSGPFECTCESRGTRSHGRVAQLSMGGAFCEMPSPHGRGEIVRLEIRGRDRVVTLAAEIVYLEGKRGFAVMFAHNPAEALADLTRILQDAGE